MSVTEKRFVKYWEEQRIGGRWSYYALYILVGTFISTIIFCTFLFLFFREVFGSLTFWVALFSGLSISTVATIATWSYNEKKLRDILHREESQPPEQQTSGI